MTTNSKAFKIGNYTLVEILGSGSMSTVYKGYHEILDRYAAIKAMRAEFYEDPQFMRFFNTESRSLARLHHPNILQVYDSGIYDDFPYIVTEYIDGHSVRDLIDNANQRGEKVPLKNAVRIILNACEALNYAHRRNILHCDIKPSNILMEYSGRVVLVDFGYARWVTGETASLTNSLRGTLDYLAPELLRGMPNKNFSDIYSLGVVFFELLTGYPPSHFAKTPNHMFDAPPDPRSINPDIPVQVENIILKALATNPETRYTEIKDMLAEVKNLREARIDHLPTASLSRVPPEIPTDELIEQEKSGHARITLHFPDTGQLIEIPESDEFSLGRVVDTAPEVPDVDLTPFSAYEWGISRMHAKFVVEDEAVKIIDLGSTNGTWHKGKRLEAHTPFKLHHSDIINLGKLKLQVLIYSAGAAS